MKVFICFILTTVMVNKLHGSDFVFSSKDLWNNNDGVFFDPHNHTGGVLDPMALIYPKKFILGERLSEQDLKHFWFKLVDYYKESPLKNMPQVSFGTKMVLECNEPDLYCATSISSGEEKATEQCINALVRSIYNTLSSTPLTGFTTSYKFRSLVSKLEGFSGKANAHTQTQAKILEMALSGAGLVEMSVSSFGSLEEEQSGHFVFSLYKDILDDLRRKNTSQKNLDLKNKLNKLGLKPPIIKWLLLTHTLELGATTDSTTLVYDGANQCMEIPLPETIKTDPMGNLYSSLLKYEDVVGIDIAGPETTCFTTRGMKNFKDLAEAVYLASKAREKSTVKNKKLLVRAHVGEGFPVTDAKDADVERKNACEYIKQFPGLKRIHNRERLIYIHEQEARKNISYILEAIKNLKNQYNDIDKYVIFRLGHLTHIDDEQAKIAKALGITADVNLSSNISTQALPEEPELIEKYLIKNGVMAKDVKSLLEALIYHGANYGEIFKHHGLKWLLKNKIPTTLGTDGSGVEHAPSLKREYLIADKLIRAWNEQDPQFKRQNININFLLMSQKKHFQEMAYNSEIK